MARTRAKEPLLEWVAAGIGLALTLFILAVIGREALSGETGQVPAVEVRVGRIVATATGFAVEIAATNRSGATAAEVAVEGVLKAGEVEVETSEAQFDYLPGHATRRGGLFFRQDPRLHRLEVRALGYRTP